MFMKRLLQVASLLLFTTTGRTQTTERLQINVGNFVVLQREPVQDFIYPFIRQIGGSYTHRINSTLALRASYSRWFQLDEIGGNPFGYNAYYEPFKQSEDIRLGDIDAHYDYQSIDLAATYQLLQTKRHELYAGAGISYTWGVYTEYTGIYNEPGYPDWLFRLADRKHRDMGLITEIGYNYMLFKKRINVGVSETVKGYTSLPFQFYTNINMGYNFNWGMKKKTGHKK
jgi:hypothetical protein